LIRGTYADPNTAAVTNYGSLGNPDLTWETNKTFDAGLEFSLFKNRINGTVEFFRRISDNLLFDVPLPVSVGVLSQIRNIGSMYNQGWEFNVSGDLIKNKDVTWNMNINLTTFKNRVTKLPQEEIIPLAPGSVQTKKLMVGHSIYDYWLRDFQGVDPTDGALLYRANVYDPINSRIRGKDDTVSISQNNAKFTYHGSAIPDFYGSFSTSVRYKFVELSGLITYQVGGKVYDATWAGIMSSGTYGSALSTDVLRRWQRPGDITDVPRMDAGQTTAFNSVSSRWLTDASNISIRNVTLSFIAPANLLGFAKMQSARFYVSGENLALFSKRKGMNVEQQFTGVTSNVYNPTRIITVGINLNF
jgi:outer membrane receptor protein involved in Fe transport